MHLRATPPVQLLWALQQADDLVLWLLAVLTGYAALASGGLVPHSLDTLFATSAGLHGIGVSTVFARNTLSLIPGFRRMLATETRGERLASLCRGPIPVFGFVAAIFGASVLAMTMDELRLRHVMMIASLVIVSSVLWMHRPALEPTASDPEPGQE